MKSFIYQYWHAWTATKGVLLSDESIKKLRQFATSDDAVNWLFINGHKDAARALNKHIEEANK